MMQMRFLALFITLPAKQSAGRMRVWRSLRALGCATLRDGVYLLPESAERSTALMQIADEVKGIDGTAELFLLDGRDAVQYQRLVALFDRSAEYAQMLSAIATAEPANGKVLRTLRREFSILSAIDFFPGEAQRQTAGALAALEARSTGEPGNSSGKIRHLLREEYQGQRWATRRHLWVDRMASAWLIQRFIDGKATFLWLDDPRQCPPQVLGFDFDDAVFTHLDGLVTFEVLAASFGLDGDPAIARIAAIVHFLDAGGVPVAEAAGIEAVLAGLRAAVPDDDQKLLEASRIFDNLYTNYRQERSDE